MGRTAKFSENLLLDAVTQYSDVCKTKIKATELAQWARNNIKGLEDVRDYHFTRPVKNLKTGNMEKRLCTQRIEELNVARDIRRRENTNLLLSPVNIDKFYELDERSQRKLIAEMRDIVSEYKRTNKYLRQQNNYMKSLVNVVNEKLESYELITKKILRKQTDFDTKASYVKRNLENEQLRKKLEETGRSDGDFDLVKYNESLKEDIDEMLNLEKVIRKYQKNLNKDELEQDKEISEMQLKTNYIDDLTDF